MHWRSELAYALAVSELVYAVAVSELAYALAVSELVYHDPRVGVVESRGKSVTRLASSEFHAFLEVLRRRRIFFMKLHGHTFRLKKTLTQSDA